MKAYEQGIGILIVGENRNGELEAIRELVAAAQRSNVRCAVAGVFKSPWLSEKLTEPPAVSELERTAIQVENARRAVVSAEFETMVPQVWFPELTTEDLRALVCETRLHFADIVFPAISDA